MGYFVVSAIIIAMSCHVKKQLDIATLLTFFLCLEAHSQTYHDF